MIFPPSLKYIPLEEQWEERWEERRNEQRVVSN
jgi:hypothetical protein